MSASFFDRARAFTKRIVRSQKSAVRSRPAASNRLRLETLEARNLLSVSGIESLMSFPSLATETFGIIDSTPILSSYASTLATVQGVVETLEQPALFAVSHLESAVQQMLQQLLRLALFSPTTDLTSAQSSSMDSGLVEGKLAMAQFSNEPLFATPDLLLASADGLSPESGSGLPAGFSPQKIRQAYGFNQITFNNGTIKGDGSGQTIAIVDAYNQPNLSHDLQSFDSMYGLPAPASFTVVNQRGGSTLPGSDTVWGMEESLDVEWAHAMAPGANIVLVEADSNSIPDLMTAVNYASNLPHVSVVSMSWGSAGEFGGENDYDNTFTTPSGHNGVTFVASTGDTGSSGAPIYPSVASNVLAVGGTQLATDSAGNYLSETAWSGSGGGTSVFETQPSFQQGVVTQTKVMRAVPDVACNASSGSPYAIYDTSGFGGWLKVYGTSAGAPQWAALVAIADQGRALHGVGTLDGATQTLPALYQMPSSNFHDITTGNNGAYSAATGYDLVTGRGTPFANSIVNSLVLYDAAFWQPVNLSGYYNRLGIASKAFSGGGLDGNGNALLIGANVPWQGSLIPLGPSNANDVVSAQGQTITLPAGSYASLTILAAAVNGNQVNQPFTITYSNNASQTFTQSLTNWQSFPSYDYEQRAVQMGSYLTSNGTKSAGPDYLSAFVLPLNGTLTVKSITLPNDSNVEVLGMTLHYVSTPSQPVNLGGYYNRLGIASKAFTGGGLDGNGNALLIGANVPWQGSSIPLGPPNTNDVVSAQGQTIALPAGSYASLTILAAAVNGNQVNQPFTITYSNNASQTFTQSLTNWQSFPSYDYEQRAVQMSSYLTSGGTLNAGPDYVSAFVLPLNSMLTIKSITLPNDSNVEVLGMTLNGAT